MKMILPTIALLLFTFSAWAAGEPVLKLTQQEKEFLGDVTLEKGGQLKLEQHLSKNQALGEGSYLVELKCMKMPASKKNRRGDQRTCKLQNYTVIPKIP